MSLPTVVVTEVEQPVIVMFLLSLPLFLIIHLVVMVNLVLDFQRKPLPHTTMLLFICPLDIFGTLGIIIFLAIRFLGASPPVLCALDVFTIRMSLMASAGLVTLMAAERWSSIGMPFWYDGHVTVKSVVTVSCVVVAVSVALSSFTFLGESYLSPRTEAEKTGNGTNSSDVWRGCSAVQHIPPEGIGATFMRATAVVSTLYLGLNLVFSAMNTVLLRKLSHNAIHPASAGQDPSRRNENAMLTLVRSLSAVFVVSSVPLCIIYWTLIMGKSVNSELRLSSAYVASFGFVADPVIHLLLTTRYRRRLVELVRCLFRRLQALRGRPLRGADSDPAPASISAPRPPTTP